MSNKITTKKVFNDKYYLYLEKMVQNGTLTEDERLILLKSKGLASFDQPHENEIEF